MQREDGRPPLHTATARSRLTLRARCRAQPLRRAPLSQLRGPRGGALLPAANLEHGRANVQRLAAAPSEHRWDAAMPAMKSASSFRGVSARFCSLFRFAPKPAIEPMAIELAQRRTASREHAKAMLMVHRRQCAPLLQFSLSLRAAPTRSASPSPRCTSASRSARAPPPAPRAGPWPRFGASSTLACSSAAVLGSGGALEW